jgi:4-hydroxyphenylacetate 3-monooxygenase
MSDYIFVSCILPLPAGSEDYAISLVVPNAAPGLRIYSRRSYASGNPEGGDYPLSTRFDETDSLVVFDDVFVPWEHIFVYRSIELTAAQFHRMAAHSLGNTQAQIRFAVKLRFFAGLARLVCDGSGVTGDPKNKQRLGQLAGKCSIPEAFVLAAEAGAAPDEFGVMRPDPAMLYTAMTLQPTLMNEVNYLLREMTGGSVIQLPSSYESFHHAESAADIDRYIRWPGVAAADRVALLKLVWDAIGSEFAGRHQQYEMFYAGEAGVVQMRAFAGYRWERATDLVERCLASTPILSPKP